MDTLNWILSALTCLFGGSSFYTIFLYRRQAKRFKTAEAFEQEVKAMEGTVSILQEQIEFCQGRINSLQELIISKDTYIEQLSGENHTLEIKHSRNKSAMNKAHECKFCPDTSQCPVLIQKIANDELYLSEITGRERKDTIR
jgi:hypothetical protein